MLTGKVAIVTGGTRGIGFATVRTYLQNGAKVALWGSRQETVEKALQKLHAENPQWPVMGQWPNITSSESVAQAMQEVTETWGRLDILVNNAGISQSTPFLNYTDDEFDKIMDLNIKALFVCSQAAARIMKAQHAGVILNTSSMVSIYGQPSGVGYPTSKFAVNGMTKSLARELGKDGIRVNAVAPGVIATDMVAALSEEMVQRLAASIPVGRLGQPEDIANAFLFLASDMASYVSGAILSVDGATQV